MTSTALLEPARTQGSAVALHDAGGRPALAARRPCQICDRSAGGAPCLSALPAVGGWARPVCVRNKVMAGQVVFAQGEPLRAVYTLRSGTVKATLALPDGRDQVCAFHMVGQVIGLDGMASGSHTVTTTAVEDTHVCAVAYTTLITWMGQDPTLHRRVSRLMGQELARAQRAMMVLGLLTAQERMAVFLLDLSRRFGARGYSAREFNLCMTRAEIGSLLGVTHETVSRSLSALQQQGQLQVDNRRVRICDLAAFESRYGVLLPS